MDVRLKSQWQQQQPEWTSDPTTDVSNSSSPYATAETTLRWSKLGKLGHVLYPTTSPYGRPTVSFCSPKHLLVGTDSAEVLIFDYSQQLVAQLSTSSLGARLGEVTCLNVSDDQSHVVAGFSQGWICVWDLEKPPKGVPQLRAVVAPLDPSRVPAPHSRIQGNESHVSGTPIKYVSFFMGQRSSFVSIDVGGLAVLHRHHRVLLERTTKSRRIFGSFVDGTNILDAVIFGSYIAVLTPQLFMVVQLVVDVFVECLKVPRARDTEDSDIIHGVIGFNEKTHQIAYSWGSQIKILNIDMESGAFSADKAYVHTAPIEWFDWIDTKSGMLILLSSSPTSNSPQLDLVLINDTRLVDSERLPPSANLIQVQVSASTLFVLGRYEFSVGQLTNWADRLLALLNNAHPTEAIELALSYFNNEGDLSVLGLPAERPLRQRVVRRAFPDIALTALGFSIQFDFENLKGLLPTCLRAAVIINSSLLESILDLINGSDEQWIHDLYLDTLISLVLARQIRTLSPVVFKELITYRYSVQQIFYLLDLAGLDVDLAFKICSQHPELAEVDIYLRNQALQDYTSQLNPPTSHTMGYLALTLTGRVYPTGDAMFDKKKEYKAKTDIYTSLFLSETTTVLQSIINYDEKAFFTALNEAFEDSFLNENAVINRQIIVNILRSPTVQTSEVYLNIFLARNYPKYPQFIILPGQAVQEISLKLCSPNKETEESQLALLSLLSVFQTRDVKNFIDVLIDANYTLVLEFIYRKEGKFRDLILLKLRNHESDLWTTLQEGLFRDKAGVTGIMHDHVSQFLAESPARFANIVVSQLRDSSIWQEIFTVANEETKLAFLDSAFQSIGQYGGQLPSMMVCTEYVSLLAKCCADGGKKLMHLLETTLTGSTDVQLPLVVDDLLESGNVDALALLLCRKDRQNEAMIYLLNHLPSVEGKELSHYTQLAVSICLDVSHGSSEDSRRLWRRLLETLMSIETTEANAELQKSIRALSESGTASTIDIAADLITSNQKGMAPFVSQLFLDLRRQERALKCFYDILEADSYKQLTRVLEGRAQGWAVSIDGECEVCGHKIAGLGIDAESLYKAWEQTNKKKDITADIDSLIAFQCHHTFHLQCLARMIGEDTSISASRRCILCETS